MKSNPIVLASSTGCYLCIQFGDPTILSLTQSFVVLPLIDTNYCPVGRDSNLTMPQPAPVLFIHLASNLILINGALHISLHEPNESNFIGLPPKLYIPYESLCG